MKRQRGGEEGTNLFVDLPLHPFVVAAWLLGRNLLWRVDDFNMRLVDDITTH